MFSADNLGAHSIFGFLESFTADYYCRFCTAKKEDTQHHYMASYFVGRTREHVDSCVARLGTAGYNPSLTGIKSLCILNDLTYFHCTDQSTVDCMHDVLEGIVPYEISPVLQALVEMQIFRIEELNEIICHFNYPSSDKNSKPPAISLPTIRIQAAEAWCLVRNLPLMLGSKVPVSNPQWQVLLLLLLDCLDIIFAPTVTEGMIDMLAYLIDDHHSLFLSVFPSQKLLPKHHFLIHYPEFLMKFGPLSQYWCMRFEAKHWFGKELASTVRCFKNITHTIAKRTQMELAHSLLNNKLFAVDRVITNCTSLLVQSLETDVAKCLCDASGLTSSDEIDVVANWPLQLQPWLLCRSEMC
jgi:hypothetical protein